MKTQDILKYISRYKHSQIVCGFCLETEKLREHALEKLREKKLDFIVANRYSTKHDPLGEHYIEPLIFDKKGNLYTVQSQTKTQFARYLFDLIETVHI